MQNLVNIQNGLKYGHSIYKWTLSALNNIS